ncbi:GNAT family N-acetyltransferase [Natronomonas sp. EA1]|uniref:GNAT family N-acetyltransferase n=1 Tax=Natronomonas sp. EA1 TaxID=3421655 RepID=UPI003EBF4FDE
MTSFIEGDRVVLRPVEEDDLAFVRDGANDPEIRRAAGGQSFPTNLHAEREYWTDATEDPTAVHLIIEAGGERVGAVELDPLDRETGTATVAYWIASDHRREGYARETLELVCAYVFDECRLHRLQAEVFGFNEASRELLESAGFREEGVHREDDFVDGAYVDTHHFGLLEREWRERE